MAYLGSLRFLLAGLAFGVPEPGIAQSLLPLDELDLTQVEFSYPMVRCAGFYTGSVEWAGPERLGEPASAQAERNVQLLLAAAAILRVRARGVEPTDAVIESEVPILLRDTRNVADLYLARFEANYAAHGEAWGRDRLWLSDSEFCSGLVEVVAPHFANEVP